MYLDTAGHVTAGVGFMLPSEAAVRALSWTPSTLAAVTDFRRVRVAERGRAANFYAPLCGAWMTEPLMRVVFRQRVSDVQQQLARAWQLEALPLSAQVALVDMAYNLGVAGLSRYARLQAAVRARDWATAAAECHRNGVSQRRNDATRAQFDACA